MVELLMTGGADPTIASSKGSTPLMRAAANGHVAVVKCLLGAELRELLLLLLLLVLLRSMREIVMVGLLYGGHHIKVMWRWWRC